MTRIVDLANQSSSRISILEGDGVASSFLANPFVQPFALGDLNGDGYDDFAQLDFFEGRFIHLRIIYGQEGGLPDQTDVADDSINTVVVRHDFRSSRVGFGSDVVTGDFDGDGVIDLAVGWDSFDNRAVEGRFEGAVGFISGNYLASEDEVRIGEQSLGNHTLVQGLDENRQLGDVLAVGDINGDGIDDIIMSEGSIESSVYVLFGTENFFFRDLHLDDLDGTNGFRIFLENGGLTRSGSNVSVGDINGDGVDDIVIHEETTYVIFGNEQLFPEEIDAGSLNGQNGFTIQNVPDSLISSEVVVAGDIDANGIDDLLIGLPFTGLAGEAYRFLIEPQDFTASLDYSAVQEQDNSRIGREIFTEFFGASLNPAGDVNGDGIDDFFVVGRQVEGDYEDKLVAFVVFGSESGSDENIDLNDLAPSEGFIIIAPTDRAFSRAIQPVGDIDGDGYSDLAWADVYDTAEGANTTGVTYIIYGGPFAGRTNEGNDSVNAGVGDNYLDLGGGEDIVFGETGNDTLNGGRGEDTLEGGDGDDVLLGGTQADRLDGGEGNDSLLGGNGNDTVEGGSGSDTLSGSVGDDNLNGGGQGDRLFGDTGADTLNGGGGADRVDYLTDTDDILVDLETGEATGGLAEGDTLISIESLFGGKGDDTLSALEDGSRINGAGGDDIVTGRSGDDILAGGNGNDQVTGGAGDDLINGNRGDDTLNGGAGDDTLRGSAGSDTFIFSNGTGDDIVLDFRANDLLDLSNTATDFTSLAEVQAAATETEAGLLIDLGGGDSVLLAGTDLEDIGLNNLIL